MTGWRVYRRARRQSRHALSGRRRRVGALCALAAAIWLAGCSGIEHPTLAPPATPRTLELGWVERDAATRFTFQVERLTVDEDGWRAEIGVTNGSDSAYRLGRGSVGLVLLDSASEAEVDHLTDDLQRAPPALRPERAEPEAPAVLGPSANWTATIVGSEVLRQGSVVRVLFGPFSRVGARDLTGAGTVLWVTDHWVRL